MNICIKHFACYCFTINIPNLEIYIDITHQLKSFLKEINTYCSLIHFIKVVLAIPTYDLGFSYFTISNDNNFVRQVFWLRFFFTTTFVLILWVFIHFHLKIQIFIYILYLFLQLPFRRISLYFC